MWSRRASDIVVMIVGIKIVAIVSSNIDSSNSNGHVTKRSSRDSIALA